MNRSLCGGMAALIVASAAWAAAPIDGAFGIQFGQTLDQVKVIESHVNQTLHNVEPPQPMSLLRFYTVETAGPQKRIYRVTGQSLTNDRTQCLEELASVMAILKSKYGEPNKRVDDIFRFVQGARSITASCDAEGGITSRNVYKLKVTYEDLGLMEGSGAL